MLIKDVNELRSSELRTLFKARPTPPINTPSLKLGDEKRASILGFFEGIVVLCIQVEIVMRIPSIETAGIVIEAVERYRVRIIPGIPRPARNIMVDVVMKEGHFDPMLAHRDSKVCDIRWCSRKFIHASYSVFILDLREDDGAVFVDGVFRKDGDDVREVVLPGFSEYGIVGANFDAFRVDEPAGVTAPGDFGVDVGAGASYDIETGGFGCVKDGLEVVGAGFKVVDAGGGGVKALQEVSFVSGRDRLERTQKKYTEMALCPVALSF